MNVRRTTANDAEAIAQILARVAEEGLIAAEPPLDVAERTQRIAAMLAIDGLSASWVLEDSGQVVGSLGAHESGPAGVLSLGMAIVPEARVNILGAAVFVALFWLTARRGATDPVCGMKVDRGKALTTEVAGKTFYFCTQGCLDSFEADKPDPAATVPRGSRPLSTRPQIGLRAQGARRYCGGGVLRRPGRSSFD